MRMQGQKHDVYFLKLTVVLQKLFDEVDMGEDHSPAAVPLQPKFRERLTRGTT